MKTFFMSHDEHGDALVGEDQVAHYEEHGWKVDMASDKAAAAHLADERAKLAGKAPTHPGEKK